MTLLTRAMKRNKSDLKEQLTPRHKICLEKQMWPSKAGQCLAIIIHSISLGNVTQDRRYNKLVQISWKKMVFITSDGGPKKTISD